MRSRILDNRRELFRLLKHVCLIASDIHVFLFAKPARFPEIGTWFWPQRVSFGSVYEPRILIPKFESPNVYQLPASKFAPVRAAPIEASHISPWKWSHQHLWFELDQYQQGGICNCWCAIGWKRYRNGSLSVFSLIRPSKGCLGVS
jgi:hypothetical protein